MIVITHDIKEARKGTEGECRAGSYTSIQPHMSYGQTKVLNAIMNVMGPEEVIRQVSIWQNGAINVITAIPNQKGLIYYLYRKDPT